MDKTMHHLRNDHRLRKFLYAKGDKQSRYIANFMEKSPYIDVGNFDEFWGMMRSFEEKGGSTQVPEMVHLPFDNFTIRGNGKILDIYAIFWNVDFEFAERIKMGMQKSFLDDGASCSHMIGLVTYGEDGEEEKLAMGLGLLQKNPFKILPQNEEERFIFKAFSMIAHFITTGPHHLISSAPIRNAQKIIAVKKNKKPWVREDLTTHTLMIDWKTDYIIKSSTTSGHSKPRIPHGRRAHMRRIFGEILDDGTREIKKRIFVRPAWVGPNSWQSNGRTYKLVNLEDQHA